MTPLLFDTGPGTPQYPELRPGDENACSNCGHPADGRKRLCKKCYRHHRQGQEVTVRQNPNSRTPGKCSECPEDAHAKGLCKFHYARMRRGPDAICVEDDCEEPKAYRARYFCEPHSPCTHSDCRNRFKARRLCDRHYQTDYLTPLHRTEREKFKEHQISLLLEERTPVEPERPRISLHGTAPPLHVQAKCPRQVAAPYQRYADALAMLLGAKILPKSAVSKARDKTARLFQETIQATPRKEELRAA